MGIDVVFPATRSAPPAAAARDHVWRALPDKPVLGLVNNTKSRASDLLQAIGRSMVRRGFVDSFFMISKPNAGVTITQSDRDLLMARAHLIVTGLGD